MTRAAGYVRVSTEEQARDGYGLAAQEQAVRAYCQAHQWDLIDLYIEAGRSGKAVRGREELARLLDDAQAGRFKRLVFWKLDRLGRNLRDLLDICDRLEGLGVGVVSIQESIDTGTPGGRMMRSVLGALAEFEREAIIERTRAGMAEKKRRGEWVGGVPKGFRHENGAIVPDPETAPFVRELFELYADGRHSLRGLVTWASQALKIIDPTSIRYVLSNSVYAGTIVDETLFNRVQAVLPERAKLPPSKPFGRERYPLSGLTLCGYCAAPLVGNRHHRWRFMRCRTTHSMGKGACQQPMVSADVLEEQVGRYVGGMQLPQEYVDAVVKELHRRRAPRVNVPQVHREMERWRRLYVLGEISEERLERELAPLKERLTTVEDLNVEQAAAYLRDVGGLWSESPRQLQREFVSEVFACLRVRGRELTTIEPKPMYAPLFVIDRQERYGGVVELMRPTPPKRNYTVPALVLPEAA